MSQFNYSDYQKVVEKAQNGGSNAVKVGFFKLKDDGDQALVRINCGSLDDLEFASVHTINANGKWMRVSCLNPLGNYGDHCALCNAVAAGNKAISKASKKVYLQMLASYKDPTTGQFTAATPVVWERPAGFSRDIANLIKTYGDAGISLKNVLLTITRNGKAGDMKTTYSLMPAPEAIFKPEMIPADFSAFNNFNIARHSYWEKTPEEIETFLRTGSFPETTTTTAQATPTAPTYTAPAYTAQAVQAVHAQAAVVNPVNPQPVAPQPAVINPQAPSVTGTPIPTIQPTVAAAPVQPAPATAEQPAARPVRNFNGFSF